MYFKNIQLWEARIVIALRCLTKQQSRYFFVTMIMGYML
jgi:hypothetical protein